VRVLHTESSVNWGGQEFRILDQMVWLRAHGHETALAARPGSEIARRIRALGLPVHEIAYSGHYNPRDIIAARRLRSFDIVDSHGSRDGSTHGFAHDVVPLVRTRHLGFPLKSKLHRRLQWRWGCTRAIATAAFVKDDLVAKGFMAADRVDVVGEWADDPFFAVTDKERHRRDVRAEFAVPDDQALVMFVGMLRGDKAPEILIDATAELRRRGRRIIALIVGGDTHSQAGYAGFLRERAATLEVSDDVRFAGYRDDVARLTLAADALAITSTAEAQSRAAPQAFASRTPVIASRIGGIPELVRAGETGRLVPPGSPGAYADAIEELFDDRAGTERQVEAAHALATRSLTLDAKMGETLDAYGRALHSSA
jgi:glycosyltransferase involved in cell wall biosynthesis